MLKNLIKYFCIITIFIGCSASKKNDDTNISKDKQLTEQSTDKNVWQAQESFTNQQVNFELKKMLAEINYLKEQLNDLDVKSSLYADPFSVYNKEIILNNGSSIFCKILSQDDEVIFVETLIGNLTINRSSIVRIVENIIVLEEEASSEAIIEISLEEEAQIIQDADLINQRQNQSSASVIMLGDIIESKDKSGNTIFTGQLKNIGTDRADLVRIDFILRKNFQGDVERLTAYATGSSHVFKDTGIISNSSIKPGAIGEFKIIIPNSIGNFIGYSYELHWDKYE
ncbi:hypothetical protein OAI93_02305 [bacterium]|jgi:hypothetical protein|nr:hypothetical protein [bacterium]